MGSLRHWQQQGKPEAKVVHCEWIMGVIGGMGEPVAGNGLHTQCSFFFVHLHNSWQQNVDALLFGLWEFGAVFDSGIDGGRGGMPGGWDADFSARKYRCYHLLFRIA